MLPSTMNSRPTLIVFYGLSGPTLTFIKIAGCERSFQVTSRNCECLNTPKCRHDHRLKQQPRWQVDQPTPGTFRWTTPSGRQYTTEPTRYPV